MTKRYKNIINSVSIIVFSVFYNSFAYAQSGASVFGKTMVVSFVATNKKCSYATRSCIDLGQDNVDLNVYVSTKGRIFDFAFNSTGTNLESGQIVENSQIRMQWVAKGSTLTRNSESKQISLSIRDTITLSGRSCSVKRATYGKIWADPDAYPMVKVSNARCAVKEGVNER